MDFSEYIIVDMGGQKFPFKIFTCTFNEPCIAFKNHWHEQMELIFVVKGRLRVKCNANEFTLDSGDLLVINSNEFHTGVNDSDELVYYVVVIDTTKLIDLSFESCETEYITQISNNLMIFKNKIIGEPLFKLYITQIMQENTKREKGYEMAVKSYIYQIFVLLIRNYIDKVETQSQYNRRKKELDRLRDIILYIDQHFTESISTTELAQMAHISHCHFCHTFKRLTGKNLQEYMNGLRIEKAKVLLKDTGLNATEIALAVGFGNLNYFSRLFKEKTQISPREFRRNIWETV